ncbi:MAG: hypothetical protein CVU73_06130 [Deltaproteobacteria bacterium HGW-Deltaproteobacteria-8]|jgi:hypothetical protein|nr:MAG: hypothetical protein CVU73_06130 [Deltaproteobacteria bacterium HGW-Deltaproteobacteria-8]
MKTEQTRPEGEGAASCPEQGSRWLRGAGFAALCVGLLAGLVLYLPWDTIWHLGLRQYAARHPELRMSWQNVDRAGMLGFRVNGFAVEAAGWNVSPRMQWVDVRLGVTPLLTVRVDSGGREARLVYFDSGAFDAQGQVNLACLGRRDIQGSLDVRSDGVFLRAGNVLEKGFLDLRGVSLTLPGNLWLGDVALALAYQEGSLRIRSFTLREPVQIRAEGTAALRPDALLRSPYTVSGEVIRGRETFPFSTAGVLGDFLGHAALSE